MLMADRRDRGPIGRTDEQDALTEITRAGEAVGRPCAFRGWSSIVGQPAPTPRRSWQDRAARRCDVGGPQVPR
jgi:hypothetical protein